MKFTSCVPWGTRSRAGRFPKNPAPFRAFPPSPPSRRSAPMPAMSLDALIFDIDGTLVDSNPAHVEAWRRALESHGYRIAPDRIEIEIGKGGDKFVPDVLG